MDIVVGTQVNIITLHMVQSSAIADAYYHTYMSRCSGRCMLYVQKESTYFYLCGVCRNDCTYPPKTTKNTCHDQLINDSRHNLIMCMLFRKRNALIYA